MRRTLVRDQRTSRRRSASCRPVAGCGERLGAPRTLAGTYMYPMGTHKQLTHCLCPLGPINSRWATFDGGGRTRDGGYGRGQGRRGRQQESTAAAGVNGPVIRQCLQRAGRRSGGGRPGSVRGGRARPSRLLPRTVEPLRRGTEFSRHLVIS